MRHAKFNFLYVQLNHIVNLPLTLLSYHIYFNIHVIHVDFLPESSRSIILTISGSHLDSCRRNGYTLSNDSDLIIVKYLNKVKCTAVPFIQRTGSNPISHWHWMTAAITSH